MEVPAKFSKNKNINNEINKREKKKPNAQSRKENKNQMPTK